MYYEDLSGYRYVRNIIFPNIYNIGWLGEERPIPTGNIPSGIIEVLERILLDNKFNVNMMRGMYPCPFCRKAIFLMNLDVKTNRFPLGKVELWIPSGKTIFVAPCLILHYIEDHQYKPPEAFLSAVLDLDLANPFNGQKIYQELAKEYYGADLK